MCTSPKEWFESLLSAFERSKPDDLLFREEPIRKHAGIDEVQVAFVPTTLGGLPLPPEPGVSFARCVRPDRVGYYIVNAWAPVNEPRLSCFVVDGEREAVTLVFALLRSSIRMATDYLDFYASAAQQAAAGRSTSA
jgi:hypothetical protein